MDPGAPGRAQLYIDGELVAQAEFPVTTPIALKPCGLTCGANPGSPITPDYQAPFRFTGTLHTVTAPWTCPATSSPTPKAKCGWQWRDSSRAGRAALVWPGPVLVIAV